MDFAGVLRDFYYSLEDRYYGVLDFIEAKGLPVYKVIDPVDEVIPSFAVFSLLVLFLILAGTWLLFFSAGQYAIAVKVVSLSSKSPISGVRVDYNYSIDGKPNVVGFSVTGSDGTFKIGELSGTVLFNFSVKKEGFLDYYSRMPEKITQDSSRIVLMLEAKTQQAVVSEKTIKVMDASVTPKRPLEGKQIKASFQCATGKGLAQKNNSPDLASILRVSAAELNGCGRVRATVESTGFLAQTQFLDGEVTIFDLVPSAVRKGKVRVLVKDLNSNALLPGIKLTIYKGNSANAKDSQFADAAGSVLFEQEPGSYFVSASDEQNGAYANNQTEDFTIAADAVGDQVLYLSRIPPSSERFLKIQVVDRNGAAPVSGARVRYSAGGIFQTSVFETGSDGKITIRGAVDSVEYYVLVSASGFVSYFGRVFPKQSSDVNFSQVLLSRVSDSPANYGRARVFVNDDVGAKVEGATVMLYNVAFATVPLIDETDATGLANFDNASLPPGVYQAFAEKGFPVDSNVLSQPTSLIAGSVLDFNLQLTLGIANIKSKVTNEGGVAVRDANVLFYESDSAGGFYSTPKFSLNTDAAGLSLPANFRVDKKVKIVVSKNGFLNTSRIVESLYRADATHAIIVPLTLFDSAGVDSLDIKLKQDVFPENCIGELAASQKTIKSGKTYGLKFDVLIPSGSSAANLKAHVRAGPDSIASINGLNIFAKSASPSAFFPMLFANYNPADKYCQNSDCNQVVISGNPAKLVNYSLGTQSTVQEFCATFTVTKGFDGADLPAGTRLELHFEAKSDGNSTQPKTQLLIIGKPFGTSDSKFTYDFTICPSDASGTCTQAVDFLTSNDSAEYKLDFDQDYKLFYTINNWSGADYTLLDANLETDNQAIQFKQAGVFSNKITEGIIPAILSKLSNGAQVSSAEIMKGVLKAGSKFLFTIGPFASPNQADSNAFLLFDVNADNYNVSVPSFLAADSLNLQFSVTVSSVQSGARLANLLVRAKVADNPLSTLTDPVDFEAMTDSQGIAVFTLPTGYPSTKYLSVIVPSTPGFEKSRVFNIPFTNVGSQEVEEFACVKFIPESNACPSDSNSICLDSKSPSKTSGSFRIKNDNCSSEVVVRVKDGYSSGGTDVKLGLAAGEFSIPVNSESQLITFNVFGRTPAGIIGQFPVGAEVKYAGDSTFRTAGEKLTVFIDHPGASPNNCFAVGKTMFDVSLQNNDDSNVFNYCYLTNTDPDVPAFSMSSEPSLFATVGSASEATSTTPITFNWKITAGVQEIAREHVNIIQDNGEKDYGFEGMGGNDVTADGQFSTPGTVNIYNDFNGIDRVRYTSYFAGNPPAGDWAADSAMVVADSNPIQLTLKDGTVKHLSCPGGTAVVSVTEGVNTVGGVPVAGSPPGSTSHDTSTSVNYCLMTITHEDNCPKPEVAGDCIFARFDLNLSSLSEAQRDSIAKVTLHIFNNGNNAFPAVTVIGRKKLKNTHQINHSFFVDSQKSSGTVIPGRELFADLGIVDFGISQIMASPDYKNGAIVDVNFAITSDNPAVEVWLALNELDQKVHAFARYTGFAKNFNIIGGAQEIPLSVYNVSWKGDNYSILSVNDYVDVSKKTAREG